MKKAKKKNNRNAVFEKVPRWQQQYLSATCVPLKKKKKEFLSWHSRNESD